MQILPVYTEVNTSIHCDLRLEQHDLCPYAFSPLSRRKLLFHIIIIIFAIIFVFTTRDFICFSPYQVLG